MENDEKAARELVSEAAAKLGAMGGRSRSERKAAAARINGRLGGRPRKSADRKGTERRGR